MFRASRVKAKFELRISAHRDSPVTIISHLQGKVMNHWRARASPSRMVMICNQRFSGSPLE
jgi:hypothetical protein